jgi:hypothetical protein
VQPADGTKERKGQPHSTEKAGTEALAGQQRRERHYLAGIGFGGDRKLVDQPDARLGGVVKVTLALADLELRVGIRASVEKTC